MGKPTIQDTTVQYKTHYVQLLESAIRYDEQALDSSADGTTRAALRATAENHEHEASAYAEARNALTAMSKKQTGQDVAVEDAITVLNQIRLLARC